MTPTERMREWRRKNPERAREQNRRSSERHRERNKQSAKSAYLRKVDYMRKTKLEQGCVVCGYNENPAALQFHHRDPVTKVAPVATIAASGSQAALEEEIAKCDVICANCHSIHHYG